MRFRHVKWNDNRCLMTFIYRGKREAGRTAIKSPCLETAFSLYTNLPRFQSHAERIRKQRHIHNTQQKASLPHGPGPVFDFLPGNLPQKQLRVEKALLTKGVDVCNEL